MNERKDELTLIVILHAKKGKEKILEKELTSLLEPTRREPGCILYEFHRSIEDPTEFMFYERYVNQEAHETHAKMPYVQNFLKKSEELLSRPLELHRYTRITN